MPLRVLEITIPPGAAPAVESFLLTHPIHALWRSPIDDTACQIRALVETTCVEPITDVLSQRYALAEGFRVLVMPVEATLPRVAEPAADGKGAETPRRGPGRVSREELYQDVAAGTVLGPVFLATVILSALVASIGLIRDDVAIIIGAMVIAPLLGPNIALALSATLGDGRLARGALRSGSAAFLLALGFALLAGLVLDVDPSVREIASRTRVDAAHVVLALAAGAVGALSFITGVPAALIGVMVAVALMPPLATAGLLAGSGHWGPALGAALLYAINVSCVNIAAVATFMSQGIRPQAWWDADQARHATRAAVIAWLSLLALLGGLIAIYTRYLDSRLTG
ncbi:TIGR00341 family protein [Alkalilimnicola sp. S0819]|uniref:TIGR00341 family protein n=1 Tax=Alkalilimnicola sp. S0819 TaxID=2613922 RepID=UPI0012613C1D|nr:TIGR00341 family protein [Alkalilimnicola sp. S0819]KAB7619563.1 TIGR00341 family protein [Alkalilimnicola sp. S0819]MPQ17614.1 TIGR00341 family protein [Alkalilimnicola sp. S0819]